MRPASEELAAPKEKAPIEIFNEVKAIYGEGHMNRTSVYKWCREFKNGRTNVHDELRSGRSSIVTDKLVEKIENVDKAPQSEYYLPVEQDTLGRVGGVEVRDKKTPEKGGFLAEVVEIDPYRYVGRGWSSAYIMAH